MALDGIYARSKNHRRFVGERLGHLAKAGYFRGTDEGEVGRIEKQHQPLPFAAGK